MTTEKTARRILALLTKTVTNGCTEQEALAAAKRALELMDEYRLTKSNVVLWAGSETIH